MASRRCSPDLATLLTVPGLGWVLIETSAIPGLDGVWNWRVLSNDELRSDRGIYEIEDAEAVNTTDGWRPLADQHVLIKIWRAHPRRSSQPDSSTRGALRPLRQLSLLDDHIEATAVVATRWCRVADPAERNRVRSGGPLDCRPRRSRRDGREQRPTTSSR